MSIDVELESLIAGAKIAESALRKPSEPFKAVPNAARKRLALAGLVSAVRQDAAA